MVFELLIFVPMILGLSVLWLLTWQYLSDKLMQTHTPRRQLIFFLLPGSVFLLVLNLVSIYTSWGYYLLFEVLGWSLTVFSLMAVLMLAVLYRRQYLPKAISAVALSYFFIHSVGGLVSLFVVDKAILWLYDKLYEQHYQLYYFLANLLSLPEHLLLLLVALGIGRLMNRLRFAEYFGNLFTRPGRAWATCGVSVVLMHSMVIIVELFPSLEDSVGYYVAFAAVDMLFLFAIFFVAVFESNREKVKQQEAFIIQQQVYVKTLESLQQDLRAFRHDYQNLLGGLYLSASEGDTEAIRQTLQQTIHYFDGRLGDQIHRVTGLARVELPEVKSLLLVKLMQAEELKVPVELEVPAPVISLAMNHGDFLRCLGILVDNALEAAAALPGAAIRIALLQDDKDLLLAVANPCAEKPRLHELARQGYSTKGEGRGTGLASYKKLVARYPNAATRTEYENGTLRQQLHIHGRR